MDTILGDFCFLNKGLGQRVNKNVITFSPLRSCSVGLSKQKAVAARFQIAKASGIRPKTRHIG